MAPITKKTCLNCPVSVCDWDGTACKVVYYGPGDIRIRCNEYAPRIKVKNPPKKRDRAAYFHALWQTEAYKRANRESGARYRQKKQNSQDNR